MHPTGARARGDRQASYETHDRRERAGNAPNLESHFTPCAGEVVRVQQDVLKRLAHKGQNITLIGPLPAAANKLGLRAEAEALLAQSVPELRASVAARVSLVHASGEQLVAARDFEAGTLVAPVAGCTMTDKEADRLLQRASPGKQKNKHVFSTPVTRGVTLLGADLVVCAAPELNLVDVASRGYEMPGNMAVVAAIAAGRCGSYVVKSKNGDYVNSHRDVHVPLLLCVATRPIQAGDALLLDADTEFWKSTRAGDNCAHKQSTSRREPVELMPEMQACEQDPGMGAHVGNQSPGCSAGTHSAASDECPPAPQKRPRDDAPDADPRSVRPCYTAHAVAAGREASVGPDLTAEEMAAQSLRMVTRMLGKAPAGGGIAAQRLAGHACQ